MELDEKAIEKLVTTPAKTLEDVAAKLRYAATEILPEGDELWWHEAAVNSALKDVERLRGLS